MTSTDRLSIVQIEHYAQNWTSSQEIDKIYQDDAVWIITSSFIIFTMHSGFGLLESGSVSAKDEVNIMVKNVVDVVFGGISYWALGFGLSFGDYEPFQNPFVGFGKFFFDPTRSDSQVNIEGWAYASFLFQLSLATTASTIVSGAVAERAKLKSYILLGCLVILIQALPAHWIWDKRGFFFQLGVVDFAGCAAVHMVGGIIGLIATIYLKPRRNRFHADSVHQMSSPTNALLGTFLLWWGWFGINAGSVWGITSGRWRLGGRAAVATIMSSIGGGSTAIVISFVKTKKLQVNFLINGILSSIVSITALCAVSRPWHALIIGSVSASFSIGVLPLLDKFHIDDPVGIVPIHLTSSIWGMIAVGIFAEEDKYLKATSNQNGLLYGGGVKLLGIQLLCTLTVLVYSASMGILVLFCISKSPLGLRVTDYEEQIGADVIEHGLAGTNVARYLVEKPLSTKTFQTVTKAIAKWKIMAKTKSREKRMEAAKQRRLDAEMTDMQLTHRNGAVANGRHSMNGLPVRANSVQFNSTNHNREGEDGHRFQRRSPSTTSLQATPRRDPPHTPLPTAREEADGEELELQNLGGLPNNHVETEERPTTSFVPTDNHVDSGLGTEEAESNTERAESTNTLEEPQQGAENQEVFNDPIPLATLSAENTPTDLAPRPFNVRPRTSSATRPLTGVFRRAPLPRPITPPDEVIIEQSLPPSAKYKTNKVAPEN